MEVMEAIRKRRSILTYKSTPIDQKSWTQFSKPAGWHLRGPTLKHGVLL